MNLQKQLSYFKSACLKLSKWKVSCGKNFNFESKTHYLSSFGLHFSKTIVIFEISTLEFFKMKNFIQNRKALKLRSNKPYLGIFKLEFDRTIVVFQTSTLESFTMQSFERKKNGTQNFWFGCFWAAILKNQFWNLW